MVEKVNGEQGGRTWRVRCSLKLALVELGHVLVAWIKGQGDLRGLAIAWVEVVSGRVITG